MGFLFSGFGNLLILRHFFFKTMIPPSPLPWEYALGEFLFFFTQPMRPVDDSLARPFPFFTIGIVTLSPPLLPSFLKSSRTFPFSPEGTLLIHDCNPPPFRSLAQIKSS